VRESGDGPEGLLWPSHEEVLSSLGRSLVLLTAVALVTAACARDFEGTGPRAVAAPAPPAAPQPPNPARNTAARNDPADRARFECAVTVQRAQDFDPGASVLKGALIGAPVGGAPGAALGALFGLIGDVPGAGAAAGAIALGGIGIMAGGLIALDADAAAYERGVAACLAGPSAPPVAEPGLVEYRLRVLNVRHDAFTSFLGVPELGDGAAGPGLVRLAASADGGTLEYGAVLLDRHVVAVAEPTARAFGATPAPGRVKLGGIRRDYWDEARWYGKPGERSVWEITARNRRPQEVRRVGLSEPAALAQYQPVRRPLFGARPEASVAVPLGYLLAAQTRGRVGGWLGHTIDGSRGIAAVVGTNDDELFPDRVYLVVTHAASAATYEALLAWSERGDDRERARPR
jgi:hypothetical protein